MFWDGERWLSEDVPSRTPQPPHQPRRVRDWLSTGVMLLVFGALLLPVGGVLAARPLARAQLDKWSANSPVDVYQEGNPKVAYDGDWFSAYYPNYMGGKARSTDTAGARASLRFRGSAIAWVGPIGPTRGRARVYLDGDLVATVNTWNESFQPKRVLFLKALPRNTMGKVRKEALRATYAGLYAAR